jgi:hypothetical protein
LNIRFSQAPIVARGFEVAVSYAIAIDAGAQVVGQRDDIVAFPQGFEMALAASGQGAWKTTLVVLFRSTTSRSKKGIPV